MSRNARTLTPRGRRIVLGFGTAASAVIAASISMGTAPVAGADTLDADPVSDLIGAFDPHAFSAAGVPDADPVSDLIGASDPHALSAAGVPDADAISHLIGALDPSAFNSSGAPTDALGLLGYGLDTYLLGPTGLDAVLAPFVDDVLGSSGSGAASVLDADPVSDLMGALDPSAFNALGLPDDVLGDLAAGLDADLMAPTALGALLDPVIDGLLGSGLSLF